MYERIDHVGALARRLFSTARNSQVTFLSAAIAYYAFVSFLPGLLLALSVATLVGGEAFSEWFLAQIGGVLTPQALETARSALRLDPAAGGATVLGLVTLTWSSLKLFRGLDTAFSTVYGTTEDLGLLDTLRNGLVVLVAIGVGVAAIGLAGEFVRRFAGAFVPGPASLVLVCTIGAALLPLYYVFPDKPVGIREVAPGTALAAIGWTLLGGAFQIYASVVGVSVYGVLGAALLLVTWFYFGAVVVLLGAVLNAALVGVGPGADPEDDDWRPREDQDGAVPNRQLQHRGVRQPSPTAMGEPDDGSETSDDGDSGARRREDLEALRTELDQLWDQLDDVEGRLETKTVDRSEFEAEMKRYVRKRQRRGHARGWGPYLVLLYGTAMTLGAFYYLEGVWAVLAMLVIWLSTLGLYALMALFGAVTGGFAAIGRVRDTVGSLRS